MFGKKKILAIGSGIAALAVIGTGTAYAAGVTAKTASPSPAYGCISGSTRTLEHVYTVAANFKGCPKGSFAVTLGAQGKTGATGKTGSQGVQGIQGPAGPAGVENVTVPFNNVTTAPYGPQSLAPGAEGTYIAVCSSGQVDFSGGYSVSSPSLQVLQDKPTWYGIASPTPTTTPASGWEVVVKNNGTTTLDNPVNVWSVCGTLDTSNGAS